MAQFKYKCVTVPELIKIGKKDYHSEAVTEYEKIINESAEGGWEYVGVDTIESAFIQGCLKRILKSIPIVGAFIRGDEAVHFKVIVFRKSV